MTQFPFDIPQLQRQRAHLSRCQRSLAFDFALAVLAGDDTMELRAEYWRLDACIKLLDRWIREIEGRAAVEEAERIPAGA